ncbi:MAG TPA: lysophospholipid acyltransferase family protein [Terriglobia bacterium]|nr:lysophospholipid acyltransferase family protein [Terriglobia bacterium]
MGGFLDRFSYVRSVVITAPLIFLYTGVMGSLSLLSSFIDSNGKLQHGCSRVWSRLILATSRVRVTVHGLENLQPGASYVLCANHQSHMDIPILLVAMPVPFRFAAKKELFRIPFLGWHLQRSGHIPIDRENPRAAIKSMREAAEKIRHGAPLMIFPEGGTSVDGEIHSFKGGGFMLAARLGAPIVPVAIRGSRRILPPNTYHVRGGAVEVSIGTPISPDGMTTKDLAERTRGEILARLL